MSNRFLKKWRPIVVVLAIFLIAISVSFYKKENVEAKSQNTLVNSKIENTHAEMQSSTYSDNLFCFQLQDKFDAEQNITVSELIRQEDSFSRLKNFNEKLHSDFKYLEVVYQPVEYIGEYHLPLDFVNGYLDSKKATDLSNQKINIDGNEMYITPLNSVQLDYNAYNYYNLQVESGKNFNENDFKISAVIPIILGNKYSQFYKINDTIEFCYLGKKMEASVIGFLPKENSSVENKLPGLDNYIIMPIPCNVEKEQLQNSEYLYEKDDFIHKDNSSADFYLKILYMQKNNGFFLCDSLEEYDSLNKEIEALSHEYELVYTVKNYY